MLCINGQVSNKVDSLIKSSINVTLTSSPLDIAALNSDISVEAVFIDEPNDIRRRTLAFMYFECNLTGLVSVVWRGSFRYNLGVEDDCCGFWVVVLTFFIFSSIAYGVSLYFQQNIHLKKKKKNMMTLFQSLGELYRIDCHLSYTVWMYRLVMASRPY